MWACVRSYSIAFQRKRQLSAIPVTGLLFLVLLLGGCDESLPPRNDPVQVLTVSMSGLVHDVEFDTIGVSKGGVPFRISVENLHDEALQLEALVQGTLQIQFLTSPPLRAEIAIGTRDLENDWVFRDGLITLGVDSGAVISPRWNHEIPPGTPVWQHLRMHKKWSPQGDPYYQSDSVDVIVEGFIQVFEKVQPLKIAPIRWTFIYTVVGLASDPNPS